MFYWRHEASWWRKWFHNSCSLRLMKSHNPLNWINFFASFVLCPVFPADGRCFSPKSLLVASSMLSGEYQLRIACVCVWVREGGLCLTSVFSPWSSLCSNIDPAQFVPSDPVSRHPWHYPFRLTSHMPTLENKVDRLCLCPAASTSQAECIRWAVRERWGETVSQSFPAARRGCECSAHI